MYALSLFCDFVSLCHIAAEQTQHNPSALLVAHARVAIGFCNITAAVLVLLMIEQILCLPCLEGLLLTSVCYSAATSCVREILMQPPTILYGEGCYRPSLV